MVKVGGVDVIDEEEEVVDLIHEAVVDQVNFCVENGHGSPLSRRKTPRSICDGGGLG